jgi:hypothetical protein
MFLWSPRTDVATFGVVAWPLLPIVHMTVAHLPTSACRADKADT